MGLFWLLGAAWAAPPHLPEIDALEAADPLREAFKEADERAVGPMAPPLVAEPPSGRAGVPSDWDITHYDLDVILDTEARQVTGEATIEARATTSDPGPLLLDADGPEITSVQVDGTDADWNTRDTTVLVSVPAGLSSNDSIEVTVSWTAAGNDGVGLGLNWGDPTFSFHEPAGARKWLVVHDDPADKATLTWRVTAPSDRTVIANGDLLATVDHGDGTSTWTWDFPWPIATYLMVVHAGTYEQSLDDGGRVPVYTWAPPNLIDQATVDFANTPAMIDYLSELLVDYPWDHYANVVAPLGAAAMEHTTATTVGNGVIGSDSAEYVNVHELGHHWWGDDVTLEEWADIWLNEGFASYTEALWAEHLYGTSGLRAYLAWQRDSYLQWQQYEGTFSVYDPDFLWGGTVYDKGSFVLDMLRTVLGDDTFFAGLREYANRFAGSNATTADFEATMEEVSGEDLSWFFDEWIYRAGDPSYGLGMTSTELGHGTWQVDVTITQDGENTWKMPMDVRIELADGSSVTDTAWVEDAETVVSFCTTASPADVSLDPNGKVLWVSVTRDDSRARTASPVCRSADGDTAEGPTRAKGCGCATTAGAEGMLPWLLVLAGAVWRQQTR